MKKKKTVLEFKWIDEDIVKNIDKSHPISLEYIEHIINNIYNKYPALDKSKISLIIKSIFENMRYFLLTGNIININNFLFDTKLHVFIRKINNKKVPNLKIKTKTSKVLKEK